MECERIRASAVWKGPAAFLRPETTAALLLRDDAGGYTAAQGGQTHHYFIHYNQQQHVSAAAGSAELLEAGNPKGFGGGGGEEFLVDDLLDLGDGGVADETEAENAAGLCQGGGGLWGQGAKAGSSDSNSDLTSEAGAADAEPLLPIGNITDLEWVSQFVDDSYPYVPPCPAISPAYAVVKPEPQQRLTLQFVPNPTNGGSTSHSRSPSAGSYTSITSPVAGVCSLSLKRPWSTVSALDDPLSVAPLRKARSKRLRTDSGVRAWALRASSLLQEPLCSSASSSSSCSSTSSSFSSHFAFLEHHQPFDFGSSPAAPRPRGRPPLHKKKHPHGHAQVLAFPWQGGSEQLALLHKEKPKQKKKKGRKPKSPLFVGFSPVSSTVAAESDDAAAGAAGTGRRCSHCGVQKTPQWRAGPMGAKTLCNACGVRYKSGRLLPEYRPACSPTFVSHVHSNSHRKVLEMRRSKELMQPPQSPQQQQRQQQQQQEEQFLALSASAAAVAAAVPQAPQPPPLGAPPAMPAQQMVC